MYATQLAFRNYKYKIPNIIKYYIYVCVCGGGGGGGAENHSVTNTPNDLCECSDTVYSNIRLTWAASLPSIISLGSHITLCLPLARHWFCGLWSDKYFWHLTLLGFFSKNHFLNFRCGQGTSISFVLLSDLNLIQFQNQYRSGTLQHISDWPDGRVCCDQMVVIQQNKAQE